MKSAKEKKNLKRKVKAAIQEENLQKYKEHLNHLLGTPPEISDKTSEEIANGEQNIIHLDN